ncbi:AAA family ATPase [Turicimonas muris]|nr:AAA family ATPase [Turicimonas muris]MBS4767822.1 AAA family ATPase [Burkholderiales bacterium]
MTGKALKDLPHGTSDFAALRMSDEIYVDKTNLVFVLASKRRKYFLIRPRRFGIKQIALNLFVSMLISPK